jgi:hypothetical protein
MKATMKNGKVIYTDKASDYAKKKGRLDYASMVEWCTEGQMVMLSVSPWKLSEDWQEQVEEEETEEAYEDEEEEVFQWFIIDDTAADFFAQLTNELIYYSEYLDMYLLGVTHWGTSWDYVLTEWKLEEE